jgi:hypothetical protein
VAGTTTAEELEHTLVFVCVGVDLYALRELLWSFMERLFWLQVYPHTELDYCNDLLFWTSCVGLQLLAIPALKGISLLCLALVL